MISYKALTSASTILEVVDDVSLYESEIFSTNGNILYPYDLETTLTATIFKDLKDVTDTFTDIRWTIFSTNSDDHESDEQWNKDHLGKNPITITKDEINGKATIQFEAYKNFSGIEGDNTLVACNRITIIDTNDLLATGIKPNNPYVGQVWIDSSTDPATMWMWNGTKWVQVGTVTTMVKNLIRNSAFSTYNYQYYDIVGDTKLSYTPVVKINNGKKWLNLVSEIESEEHRGIRQITDDTEKIYINSEYSFQFLVYNNSDESNQIMINIYSLNSLKEKTLIYQDLYTIDKDIKHYFTPFKTLNNTNNIEVEIIGLDNYKYDFCITELALYNTSNYYPWEASPYDYEMAYDPEALFNALTYNGKIQGIYSMVNPETGQIQYYFNAEYIQSGTLKGEYIDAKNLIVRQVDKDGNPIKDKDGNTIKTLEIDRYGNVNLVVKQFKLASSNQTIEEFIFSELDKLTPEQLKFLLYQIEKDHEQAQIEYEQYIKDENLKAIDYNDEWDDYFTNDEELKEAESNTDSYEELIININKLRFNANNTVTVKDDSSVHNGESFILGKARLGFAKLGLGTDDKDSNNELWRLLYFTYKAYDNSYINLVQTIENMLINETDMIATYDTEEHNIDDDYADYSIKNALLYKLFIVCEDYITNKKITVVTDQWSNLAVECDKIVQEVGEIKSAYETDSLINAFGSIANETITAESIINKVSEGVSNPENKEIIETYRETIINQTSEALDLTAEDFKKGLKSSVKVSTDGILLDSNGSLINMNGNAISISSENIDLNGYVTFKKLESKEEDDNTTIIDGGYLKSNSIDADSINTSTLSADMITTGSFSNKDKTSVFNLDNGTFKLGDKLIYDEYGNLSFSGITITDSDLDIDMNLPKWIQKWNTGKTFINGDDVITPRAFIGNYDRESISGLTGIFIGNNLDTRNDAGEEGKIDGGIVGYYCNEPTFRLNVDGTAEFGPNNGRKLKIDIIDNKATLIVPTINGDEISAYKLNVLKIDKVTNNKTDKSTLNIDEYGNVSLTPSEFYLYNGETPAISLVNNEVSINADNITTGKMHTNLLDITDGGFEVKDNDKNITFKISADGKITMSPSEFVLNSSTNGSAISYINGVTNINADCITSGQINSQLIRSESIETDKIAIGSAVTGTNNLTKNALFYKCTTLDEIEEPTLIDSCTLGQGIYEGDNYYDYTIASKDSEQVFIQVDLKQFYNITASKIYFKDKSLIYYYNLKYSLDNKNWHDWRIGDISNESDWLNTNIDEDYKIDMHQIGITARYFRLYLNGNNSTDESESLISSLYAWELYDGGVTTSIDANGIITGKINTDRIETNSLTTNHINLSNDNFTFKDKDGNIVFGIEKDKDTEDEEGQTHVTINPDTFILGDGISLIDNELNINASYIKSGEINANLITVGELNGEIISANSIKGDRIDGRKLAITKTVGDREYKSFEITDQGTVIVNGGDFLIKSDTEDEELSTVQGLVNDLDNKISSYIRMSGDSIELYKINESEDSEKEFKTKTVITSDKLAFMYEENEVAYISNQKMYIENAEVKNNLTIGKNAEGTYNQTGFFDFIHRNNGHLSLKWRKK